MDFGLTLSLGTLLIAAEISVGVAPFTVLGLNEQQAEELRQNTVEILVEDRRRRRILPLEAIDQAIEELDFNEEELATCLQDGQCSSRIARLAQADELLVGSAAGLGGTYVLRLALINAQQRAIEQEVQQTVDGGMEDLTLALNTQIERILPAETPFFRTWWFWTIISTVVITSAVVTSVMLLRPQEDPIDTYPLP